MMSDGKMEKIINCGNIFKGYIPIISDKINPESDMGLWRSGRRGSTSEVSNQSLDQVVIDMNNMWRNRKRANGVGMSTRLR